MKYQIYGPNGNKVCIVEVKSTMIHVEDRCTIIEFGEGQYSQKCRMPDTWVAIPLEFIEK